MMLYFPVPVHLANKHSNTCGQWLTDAQKRQVTHCLSVSLIQLYRETLGRLALRF